MNAKTQSTTHKWAVSVPDWTKHILLVKVGSECRPAGEDDIKDIKDSLDAAFSDPSKPKTVCIVTHHQVQMELVPVRT